VVLVPISLVGTIALSAHLFSRWVPYYVYRFGGTGLAGDPAAPDPAGVFVLIAGLFRHRRRSCGGAELPRPGPAPVDGVPRASGIAGALGSASRLITSCRERRNEHQLSASPPYRRAERLALLLEDLRQQERLPDEVIVVDNDAVGSARSVVESCRAGSGALPA